MNAIVFLLVPVFLLGNSEQTVVHKHHAGAYARVEVAGAEAHKIIEEAKIHTEAEKRYLFNQADDFYHYISNTAYILNKAVYSKHLDVAAQKELEDVTKLIGKSATSVLDAINDGDYVKIKRHLTEAIERAAIKVKVLSHLALEADKTEGAKITANYINRATKALHRGFLQMKGRHTFFGKTNAEIEHHVLTTGIKAKAEMDKVQGDDATVVRALKTPAGNLVDLIDRVLQRIEDLLYDEENIPNAREIRELYKKLSKVYSETVDLKVRFVTEVNGKKLKEDLKKLSDKAAVLFKELTNLISGAAAEEITEEVLPQTETGVLFLFYYLDLYAKN